jgi:hypothetical protein
MRMPPLAYCWRILQGIATPGMVVALRNSPEPCTLKPIIGSASDGLANALRCAAGACGRCVARVGIRVKAHALSPLSIHHVSSQLTMEQAI